MFGHFFDMFGRALVTAPCGHDAQRHSNGKQTEKNGGREIVPSIPALAVSSSSLLVVRFGSLAALLVILASLATLLIVPRFLILLILVP